MRPVRYVVAMSPAGYIDGPKDELDWIVMDPELDFNAMMSGFDTVLMELPSTPKARRPIYTASSMSDFVCDMSVLSPEERETHVGVIKVLFGAVQEIRELANGYAFRLPNDEIHLMQVVRFVAKERLCCPFFGFRIEVDSESDPIWLSLTGREGVKPFIKAEIGEALPETVVQRSDQW